MINMIAVSQAAVAWQAKFPPIFQLGPVLSDRDFGDGLADNFTDDIGAAIAAHRAAFWGGVSPEEIFVNNAVLSELEYMLEHAAENVGWTNFLASQWTIGDLTLRIVTNFEFADTIKLQTDLKLISVFTNGSEAIPKELS